MIAALTRVRGHQCDQSIAHLAYTARRSTLAWSQADKSKGCREQPVRIMQENAGLPGHAISDADRQHALTCPDTRFRVQAQCDPVKAHCHLDAREIDLNMLRHRQAVEIDAKLKRVHGGNASGPNVELNLSTACEPNRAGLAEQVAVGSQGCSLAHGRIEQRPSPQQHDRYNRNAKGDDNPPEQQRSLTASLSAIACGNIRI